MCVLINPLNANPEKWSNTLKQIVGNLPTICLSVFDHFMNLALEGLSEKKLYFNCTKPRHRAADCRSSKTCLICKNKHHSSICDKGSSTSTEPLLTTTENNVIYPVELVKINGVKCSALLGFREFLCLRRPFRLFENKPNQKRNKNYRDLNKFNY